MGAQSGVDMDETKLVELITQEVLKALGDKGAAQPVGAKAPGGIDRDLAAMIDHTLLKPEATAAEVEQLCKEARQYGFCSVCVNTSWVARCRELLRGSSVKVCCVVGFPLGAMDSRSKAYETREAIGNGADEIDMVINVGALKSGNDAAVFDDIRAVREATRGKVLKVILETSLLSKEEKVRACVMCKKAGADFVSPLSLPCNEEGCIVGFDRELVQARAWNYEHLTDSGSKFVARTLLIPYLQSTLQIPAR